MKMTIVNADGLILGRLASNISKRLILGEEIIIVNTEKAVISGSRLNTFEEYNRQVNRGTKEKGPYYPKRPDQILKRTIRGMLPYKKPKGKQAYKRLKVFVGAPEKFGGQTMETLAEANAEKLTCPYFTVAELAKEIGWEMSK